MTGPLRVLHPITRMIVGGAQLNTLYACAFADPDRFRCEILTGPQTGPEGSLLRSPLLQGIRLHTSTWIRREIRPWFDAPAFIALRHRLRSADPPYAVVHTHTSKAGILGRYAARSAGVPVIIHTAHGWQWTHARSGSMNRFIIEAERRAARFSDRIIVVTGKDIEKGLEAGVGTRDQYVLIESAIRLDHFDPDAVSGRAVRAELGIPEAADVAGTVGRFVYQKAPEVMLRAACRLLAERPGAHFIYVGDGPQRDRVLREVAEAAEHPRLHLVGLRDDIPRLLAAMDVFLLSSRYEGLPRVVVEAMAMRLPVVSTPADGVVDVVVPGATGALVSFENPAELADAAGALLDDLPRARALGARGRALVLARFDVRDMVRRIEDLYSELAEIKAAGPGRTAWDSGGSG